MLKEAAPIAPSAGRKVAEGDRPEIGRHRRRDAPGLAAAGANLYPGHRLVGKRGLIGAIELGRAWHPWQARALEPGPPEIMPRLAVPIADAMDEWQVYQGHDPIRLFPAFPALLRRAWG